MFMYFILKVKMSVFCNCIMLYNIVWICYLKGSWVVIIILQIRVCNYKQYQIILESVFSFYFIFQKYGFIYDVIGYIVFYYNIVSFMDIYSAVERLMEIIVFDIGFYYVIIQMEVNGITFKSEGLFNIMKFNIFNVGMDIVRVWLWGMK